jgi:hypothetical protein
VDELLHVVEDGLKIELDDETLANIGGMVDTINAIPGNWEKTGLDIIQTLENTAGSTAKTLADRNQPEDWPVDLTCVRRSSVVEGTPLNQTRSGSGLPAIYACVLTHHDNVAMRKTAPPGNPAGLHLTGKGLAFFSEGGQVEGQTHLFHLAHLGLDVINVVFFVPRIASSISLVPLSPASTQTLMAALYLSIAPVQRRGRSQKSWDVRADMDSFEIANNRDAFQEQDAGDMLFGVAHFGDGAFFDCFVQHGVAPILSHLAMNHILVNRGQFVRE